MKHKDVLACTIVNCKAAESLLSATDGSSQHCKEIKSPLEDPLLLKKISYYSRLNKIKLYIQQPDQIISLSKAAEIACMEKTAFAKFFKRTIGMTFYAFIQQCRIVTAIRHMMSSDLSIAAIAYNSGFGNISSFGRAFKKITGLTPSEYRRRLLADGGLDS
ncbi:MAG TPA: helix-turn-helix domain-containing protein [Candidatus Angelobacter sp.]|nr:helix-turn-helix domain-containing protein [Candidatus Angelobacter sp.]